MATVDSWFRRFAERHVERVPREDWPAPGSEFWAVVKAALVRHGVEEYVADEASRIMAEGEPVFPDRFVAALLATVRQVWKSSEVAVAGEGGGRESAERASRDCDDCGGRGLATRFRHESRAPGRPEAVVFYCLCPFGRWVENAHRTGDESSREARRRIPDLADVPELQLRPVPWSDRPDNRHRYRLAEWDAERGEPRAVARFDARRDAVGRMLRRAEEAAIERIGAEAAAF